MSKHILIKGLAELVSDSGPDAVAAFINALGFYSATDDEELMEQICSNIDSHGIDFLDAIVMYIPDPTGIPSTTLGDKLRTLISTIIIKTEIDKENTDAKQTKENIYLHLRNKERKYPR